MARLLADSCTLAGPVILSRLLGLLEHHHHTSMADEDGPTRCGPIGSHILLTFPSLDQWDATYENIPFRVHPNTAKLGRDKRHGRYNETPQKSVITSLYLVVSPTVCPYCPHLYHTQFVSCRQSPPSSQDSCCMSRPFRCAQSLLRSTNCLSYFRDESWGSMQEILSRC